MALRAGQRPGDILYESCKPGGDQRELLTEGFREYRAYIIVLIPIDW